MAAARGCSSEAALGVSVTRHAHHPSGRPWFDSPPLLVLAARVRSVQPALTPRTSSWAPTWGVITGATVIVVYAMSLAREIPVVAVALLLAVLPALPNWPVTRGRAVRVAAFWTVLGLASVMVGGAGLLAATVPALIGAGVGWGAGRSASNGRSAPPRDH